MKVIFDVPIEPFESRYSNQWRKWFSNFYDQAKIEYYPIAGRLLTTEIQTGSFLDVHGTNYYKAGQLENLIAKLYSGIVEDGDWFFFHDLWFPGIEMLAYIRDATGIKFKIAGCLHAGGWDPHDYIFRTMRRMWTLPLEEMIFGIADKIFVATSFHKNLIMDHFTKKAAHLQHFAEEVGHKLHVTGFPIYPGDFISIKRAPAQFVYGYANANHSLYRKGKPLIVFPHRLDPEKNPQLFDELSTRRELAGFDFLKTKEVCRTKSEYYKLLQQADYAVSFADQETWGIAMQEAAFCGAISFVPARLSYREMYSPALQYKSMDELVSALVACEENDEVRQLIVNEQERTNHILQVAGGSAIEIMMRHMGVM